ncbi:MAG: hypothetical protein QOC64_3003, partial [Solirubrobacteraceae bacterium]|nr:hypothetical protein [Solirubrobacteraceae bacterium]
MRRVAPGLCAVLIAFAVTTGPAWSQHAGPAPAAGAGPAVSIGFDAVRPV